MNYHCRVSIVMIRANLCGQAKRHSVEQPAFSLFRSLESTGIFVELFLSETPSRIVKSEKDMVCCQCPHCDLFGTPRQRTESFDDSL